MKPNNTIHSRYRNIKMKLNKNQANDTYNHYKQKLKDIPKNKSKRQ